MKLRKIFFTMLAAALFICVSPRMSAYATSYVVPAGETGSLGDLASPPSSPTSFTLFSGDTLTIGSGATLTIDFGDTLTIEQGASVNSSGVIENNGTIINRGTISNASGAELRNQALGVIDNNTVTITTNNGTVTNNNNGGNITTNNGAITNNNAMVDQNQALGVITNNSDTIQKNLGSVTNNFGSVTANDPGAIVENNFAFIGDNAGRVINNFGGTVNNLRPAENNYYEVTVTGGHTTNSLTSANNRLWLKSDGSAVFTPEPGYVIKNAVSSNANAIFTNNSGVWTLTANNLSAATAVTLTVEALPASSVPHTGSDRQTPLMLSLALLSGAVLLSGVIGRKRRA